MHEGKSHACVCAEIENRSIDRILLDSLDNACQEICPWCSAPQIRILTGDNWIETSDYCADRISFMPVWLTVFWHGMADDRNLNPSTRTYMKFDGFRATSGQTCRKITARNSAFRTSEQPARHRRSQGVKSSCIWLTGKPPRHSIRHW